MSDLNQTSAESSTSLSLETTLSQNSQTTSDHAASNTTESSGAKSSRRPRKTKEEIIASRTTRLTKNACALRLIKTGKYTVRQISEIADVSTGTVSKINQMYKANPQLSEADLVEQKRGPDPEPFKVIPWHVCIFLQFIIHRYFPSTFGIQCTTWTANAIAILLCDVFEIKVTTSFLYKFLRNVMNFTSKAATKHNPTRDLMLINKFVEKKYREIVRQALRRGEIIVFLDETHIASDGRGHGFAAKNRRAIIEHQQNVEHSQGSILTFIGPSGFFEQIIIGDQTMTSELFISCIKKLMGNHRGKKFFLILDQAPAHTAKATKEFLDSNKVSKVVSYEYLPAKAPELNPVEQYNNEFKGDLRRLLARNQDELHMNALKVTGNYRHNPDLAMQKAMSFCAADECSYAKSVYEDELRLYNQELAQSSTQVA